MPRKGDKGHLSHEHIASAAAYKAWESWDNSRAAQGGKLSFIQINIMEEYRTV
jgi:hypothetical protein